MNIFRKTSQQNSHFSVSWHSASVSLKKKLRTLDPPPLCLRACPQPLGFFYAFPNQLQPTLPAEKGRKVSLHFCTVTGVYCSLDTYSADKKNLNDLIIIILYLFIFCIIQDCFSVFVHFADVRIEFYQTSDYPPTP